MGDMRSRRRAQVEGARVAIIKGSRWRPRLQPASSRGSSALPSSPSISPWLSWALLSRRWARQSKSSGLAGAVEQLRALKDADEIELLRNAVELSSKLFRPLLRSMRSGLAESAIAARLESMARRAGAEGMSFPTIVASAERSALPHGVASAAKLPATGFVVLDYGIVLDGYCSDMTRTVHLGKAPAKARALYDAVLEAQLAAIRVVRPGATAAEVDHAARRELKRARLDRFFSHSTGHGVGLEIHELPRLSARSDEALRPGMVVTVEPGVYLPGRCGIRIEDMLLVTESGNEVLTPVSKELIELN